MPNNDELLPCPFESKIKKTKDCWLWQGAKQSNGYGNFRSKLAHRISYEKYVGVIPDGLTIDHLCRNRICVNPDHLEVVTQYVNNMRGNSPTALNKRKTHCINGHKLSGENIKVAKRPDGVRRKCKVCDRDYKRKKVEMEKDKITRAETPQAQGDAQLLGNPEQLDVEALKALEAIVDAANQRKCCERLKGLIKDYNETIRKAITCKENPENLTHKKDVLNKAQGDAWQDISTAPKDVHVHVYIKGEQFPRVGFLRAEVNSWYLYNTLTKADSLICANDPRKPTHWQPLPPPPTDKD